MLSRYKDTTPSIIMTTSELSYVEKWLSKQCASSTKTAADVIGSAIRKLDAGTLAWLMTGYRGEVMNCPLRVRDLVARIYDATCANTTHDSVTARNVIARHLMACKFVIEFKREWYVSNTIALPSNSQVHLHSTHGPIITSVVYEESGMGGHIMTTFFARGSIYNEIANGTPLDNIDGPMTGSEHTRISNLATELVCSSDPNKKVSLDQKATVTPTDKSPAVTTAVTPTVPRFILDQLQQLRSAQVKLWSSAIDDAKVWSARLYAATANSQPQQSFMVEYTRASELVELERSRIVMIDDFIKTITSL